MEVDWYEIWKEHSPYYRNGEFYLELEGVDRVYFEPGEAFGDGSHETTNLILKVMREYVCSQVVVDLGAGSGVLSFVASRYGAKSIYAYEIEEGAISAMKANIELNSFDNIYLNKKCHEFDVVMVNMISSEQKIAFSQHPYLLKRGVTYLISGILAEEKEAVLAHIGACKILAYEQKGPWALIVARS